MSSSSSSTGPSSIDDPTKSGRKCFEEIFGPAPGKFVRTTHGETHYILEGPEDGPLVVLQHGLGGHGGLFDGIASDLVGRLNCRVLRYDFYDRGYSESDPVRYPVREVGVHPLDFTLGLYVQQLRDVLSGLGLEDEPFVHCGHSNGGVVGIGYAASSEPGQVKGLALIDSICLQASKPLAARVADLPLLGGFIVRLVGLSTFVKFCRGSCHDPDHPDVSKFLRLQERNARENPRYFASMRSTNGNCAGFVGSAEPEYRTCCEKRVPIQLIWGKDDVSVPYSQCERMRKIAQELGTDVKEESFEGMPHNVFFADAKPKECSELIVNFVKGQLRKQGGSGGMGYK